MAQEYYRFEISLAIPKTEWEILSQAQKDEWVNIVRAVKLKAQEINAGTDNKEDTMRAKRHICLHEFGLSCPPEEDI